MGMEDLVKSFSILLHWLRLTIFVSLITLTAGCGVHRGTNPGDLTSDISAIYSTVINESFADSITEYLNISTTSISRESPRYNAYFGDDYYIRTSFEERVMFLSETYQNVDSVVLRDFQIKFEAPFEFANELNLDLSRPYRIIVESDSEPHTSVEIPLNLIRLSQVGFNADRSVAFVEISYACAALCGFGDHILLQKDSTGVWKITQRFPGGRS